MASRDCPLVSLEQWSFLEKIFNKTKLEERTWAKLVNLDTLYWYCDGLVPTATAHRYGLQVRQRKPITPHFDFFLFTLLNSRHPSTLCRDGRCQEKGLHQVASCFEKTSGRPTFQGDGSSNPSLKRKQPEKTDLLPKKPKTVPEPVMGLKAKTKKLGPRKGKGHMTGSVPVTEKAPVLLHEDFKYALEQLSSIITADDYEDSSNHTTEAMGETGLFCIA